MEPIEQRYGEDYANRTQNYLQDFVRRTGRDADAHYVEVTLTEGGREVYKIWPLGADAEPVDTAVQLELFDVEEAKPVSKRRGPKVVEGD